MQVTTHFNLTFSGVFFFKNSTNTAKHFSTGKKVCEYYFLLLDSVVEMTAETDTFATWTLFSGVFYAALKRAVPSLFPWSEPEPETVA